MSDYNLPPPPPSADEDEETFIGPSGTQLGSGYRANVAHRTTHFFDPAAMGESGEPVPYSRSYTTPVPPRYHVGDEWAPQTNSWRDERIADLQSQLVDAGLLDKGKYQRGYWDDTSAAAYKKLLGYSNVSGLDDQSTLSRYREIQAKYGATETTGATRQPFLGRNTDPEYLKNLLDDVAVRTIGRRISPEENAQFVTAFNQSQVAVQRQEYDLTGAGLPGGTGGTVTDVEPGAQAEKFVRDNNPQDVAEYDAIQRYKQFQALLGS